MNAIKLKKYIGNSSLRKKITPFWCSGSMCIHHPSEPSFHSLKNKEIILCSIYILNKKILCHLISSSIHGI